MRWWRDHPRVRGEQRWLDGVSTVNRGSPPCARGTVHGGVAVEEPLGSPPRARGTEVGPPRCFAGGRITPACAGNRTPQHLWGRCSRDRPRVRGEQHPPLTITGSVAGSPPRAQGTDAPVGHGDVDVGTTPACAGNRGRRTTFRRRITPACAGNSVGRRPRCSATPDHPRVRGEQGGELADRRVRDGITPACAGNRTACTRGRRTPADHPRVRGEQLPGVRPQHPAAGSPPRARGTAPRCSPAAPGGGITPACAGNSVPSCGIPAANRDHPRVRGEQDFFKQEELIESGSPPRARGTGRPHGRRGGAPGITPACAGNRNPVHGTGF